MKWGIRFMWFLLLVQFGFLGWDIALEDWSHIPYTLSVGVFPSVACLALVHVVRASLVASVG